MESRSERKGVVIRQWLVVDVSYCVFGGTFTLTQNPLLISAAYPRGRASRA